ncbi:L-rhamnose mutarotase [Termitidicoccus mucosus]|uniref:L-rhamnose mutarotase n=1 Tax=Termitidicoccus mucosus TaxID=1184151 RepID=A0A178IML6_9BACT|nr:L-rhamnose mutarotase [Opitutaceae bacterium TSB47]
MIRKTFLMRVNPGCEDEYQCRHSPICADLAAALKSHGSRNYLIFLDPQTRQLFGYVEIESEERWAQVAQTAACRRWWKFMADIMPSNPNSSPVSHGLKEVFHLA